MFTNYKLRSALIQIVTRALAETGVQGFKVMARNPQVMANADRVVLVDYLFSRRNGFQGREVIVRPTEGWVKNPHFLPNGDIAIDIDPPREVFGQEQWVETVAWQFSILRKRLVSDDISTMTGDDVAKLLVAWFNSAHGAAVMRGNQIAPFAPMFTKEIRAKPYTDDSDIHQFEAAIDFHMSVVQTFDLPSADVKKVEITDVPI